ncbi:MAG: NAD-dependent dehydratase [Candidatus Sericytochromatia bacterium]|nr:MAG: NAD-dependent dehydratase [Candidatus Sericytochromatia bacterium]
MKKVLITGGAGFIGSHLCKAFLNKDYKVICLDNLFTGSLDNIKDLIGNNNFEFIKHDINIPIKIKVDEIYNFACPASPIHYQYDPIYTLKTNFIGTLNLLELAKENNSLFFQASTSEVYGNPLEHPQNEKYFGNVNNIGVRACYDEGKRVAETLCFDFYRKYNIKLKVIRIFNTYGPNMLENDGRVVSNFIVQAIKNNDITVYGDGQQTRSFCYISDLIDGIIKMSEASNFIGPVNLGNPEEYKIIELAQKIIDLSKSKSKIIFKNLPEDDPLKRKPDIHLANHRLNWKPKVKLDEGLIETIQYFRNKIER